MRTLNSLIGMVLFVTTAQTVAAQANYGDSNGTFPRWEERAVAELTNRARVDPAAELAACPAGACLESACYSTAAAPLLWSYDLNQSSRFHSVSMAMFPFFAHDTPCVLFSDLDARFPGTSDGSFASSCSGSGTTTAQARVNLFGATFMGENIASGFAKPHDAFYVWLYESAATAACGFTLNNGHRYNILTNSGPALGVGNSGANWTQDFGGSGSVPKIPSGSHWTATNHVRDAAPADNRVEFWANWYHTTGGAPTTATVVLDSIATTMTRARGTATNGAYTVTVNNVSAACHTYYFAFVDSSLNAVRYPATGVLGFGAGCPDYQGGATGPASPAGVTATATSSTQVQVSWNAVIGATQYEVYRRNPGDIYRLRGTSVTTSYNDNATSGTAYLYRVRAVNASGSSADSAADLATTVMFTNDPLAAGLIVRATHLSELRTAVNAVRAQAVLGVAAFTDTAAAGLTVKATHVAQLRSYLDEATTALGRTTGGWTDASLVNVAIKATHFQEIRNRVK